MTFTGALKRVRSHLRGYASAVFLPQLAGTLHSNWPQFLQRKSITQLLFHRLKRALYLRAMGQERLLVPRIPQATRHILWVYLGMPQLGDSIMDLSARVLFAGAPFKVDLYSTENVASLYRGDPLFAAVHGDAAALDFEQYDFVVLQALSRQCMKFKARHLPKQEFLALQAYYYGPEFNRLEFGYNAVSHYGALPVVAPDAIKPVFNLALAHKSERRQSTMLALVVGGVVEYRTYAHWDEFVALVLKNEPETEIVLIGSANGRELAHALMQKHAQGKRVCDKVGKQTIAEVFALIRDAALLVCADGGLMHLGRASRTPILALLAGPIHPLMRFAAADRATAVHALDAVSDIEPQQLFTEYQNMRSPAQGGLRCVYLGAQPCCTTSQSLPDPD